MKYKYVAAFAVAVALVLASVSAQTRQPDQNGASPASPAPLDVSRGNKKEVYLEVHDQAAGEKILAILASQRSSEYSFTETKTVVHGSLPLADVVQLQRSAASQPLERKTFIRQTIKLKDFFRSDTMTRIEDALRNVDKSLYKLDVKPAV